MSEIALSRRMTDNSGMSLWFVYIIQAKSGKLYTGITTDVERRFKEHQSGVKGAKFFRSDRPDKIVWSRQFANRSAASKQEAQIKKWTRQQKLEWIQSSSESNSSSISSQGL